VNSEAKLTRAAALVAALGIGLVAAVSWQAEMLSSDAITLAALAGGVALLGSAGCALALRQLRSAPLGAQVAVIVAVPILASLIGTWLGARAMFLSAHDLGALVVLLVSAGTVACSTALLLGARVARSGDALLTATRRLGETEPPPGPGQPGNPPDESAPLEFTRVAHELEATSARLDEARRRERALEASRRELIAWISHDLRTPLAGIRAIAEALEDGLAADDYTLDRYHETLRLEADRLSGLVDDLFELSRAQQGMIRLEWERVSLRDLVSDAIAGISPIAEAKGVTIEGRVREQQPELRVSPPELLRALRNILENAVRHTPSDGSVVVEAGLEGTDAIVSIVDTGGGIADADMDRVFDVGFRADPARTPGEGAGLGLAIARELVKAHDGDISVRNQNGGAQFVVRLPVEGSSG
jgi:signal transduction histidine kinase